MDRIDIKLEFTDPEEMRRVANAIIATYPPLAYGTALTAYMNAPTVAASTQFTLVGHRFGSCD